MWSISETKQRGRLAFKANYWQSVAVSFVMGIFMTGAVGVASNRFQGTASGVSVDATAGMSSEQAALIATVVLGIAATIGFVATIVRILVANPIEVGGRRFFKRNDEDPTAEFGIMTEGFQDYGRVFVTMLVRDIFITLWLLLLVIPGVMKSYSYRMVPYIIKDNPELSPMEVLARSQAMMRGNRWKAFVMDLSFIGWILLGVITFNLGNIFWTQPYMNATHAALYQQLSQRV